MKRSVEAVITQRPYLVCLECPSCEHENEFDYNEFCNMYGEPPDWDYECITCEKCGEELQIDGQDWS